ncbi:MAG: hypothetical protein KAG53_05315 [Endozoicomonadaceae bacterium]|nr:hypothetical protein [Endozoicomonadaceae bacterium]
MASLLTEQLRTVTSCSHDFHADCLDEWLQEQDTSPVCRTASILIMINHSNTFYPYHHTKTNMTQSRYFMC